MLYYALYVVFSYVSCKNHLVLLANKKLFRYNTDTKRKSIRSDRLTKKEQHKKRNVNDEYCIKLNDFQLNYTNGKKIIVAVYVFDLLLCIIKLYHSIVL